jgi:hypothetical protein
MSSEPFFGIIFPVATIFSHLKLSKNTTACSAVFTRRKVKADVQWAQILNFSSAIVCTITCMMLVLSVQVYAQSKEEPAKTIAANEAPSQMNEAERYEKNAGPKIGTQSRFNWMSSYEFALSSIVLIFGALLFAAELAIIKFTRYSPDQSTKLVAVTLIIVATLFIITAGFSSEQIAPAMGLFGTVAGYLLGRSQNEVTIDKSS